VKFSSRVLTPAVMCQCLLNANNMWSVDERHFMRRDIHSRHMALYKFVLIECHCHSLSVPVPSVFCASLLAVHQLSTQLLLYKTSSSICARH